MDNYRPGEMGAAARLALETYDQTRDAQRRRKQRSDGLVAVCVIVALVGSCLMLYWVNGVFNAWLLRQVALGCECVIAGVPGSYEPGVIASIWDKDGVAWERLARYRRANDEYGVSGMLRQGDAVVLNKGTHVLVTAMNSFKGSSIVRVLDGPYAKRELITLTRGLKVTARGSGANGRQVHDPG